MNTKTDTESLNSKGIKTDAFWDYNIRNEGSSLIFSFKSRPYFRTLRSHTTSNYYPFIDVNMSQGDALEVKKGQWLEGLVDGRWSFLSDADNR